MYYFVSFIDFFLFQADVKAINEQNSDYPVIEQDVEVVIEEQDSHLSKLAKLLSTSPREWSEEGVFAWMHYVINQFNLDSSNVSDSRSWLVSK